MNMALHELGWRAAASAAPENVQRAAVVAEARRWIGTPYHNCADVRGAGVDCGMLLVRVFVDTGLVPPFDPRPYPPDWHLHRSEERYLGFIFDRVSEVEKPQPGDVAVYRFGRCYSHGGIVTEAISARASRIGGAGDIAIVHAYARVHRVVEEVVSRNSSLREPKRAPRYFSYWKRADQ